MSKPIEPGCLALVIAGQPHNVGMTVQVLRSSKGWMGSDWVVAKADGSNITGNSYFGLPTSQAEAYAMTSQLLRIDGDERVSTEQREEASA